MRKYVTTKQYYVNCPIHDGASEIADIIFFKRISEYIRICIKEKNECSYGPLISCKTEEMVCNNYPKTETGTHRYTRVDFKIYTKNGYVEYIEKDDGHGNKKLMRH